MARLQESATIAQLFEARVREAPDHIALVFGDTRLSYADLDARASQLARHLVARGVGPEVVVGVFLPRGIDLVVALLAILKAGGAYLPLDPEYPAERVELMLADGAARAIVTLEALGKTLGTLPEIVVSLETSRDAIAAHAGDGPASTADGDALCYVIYTSGSTGRPKGIEIRHRGVVNYLAFLTSEFQLGPGEVVLNLTSISFDPSVRDIFGPLVSGATLVMVDAREAKDPRALLRAIERCRVTAILSIVPSFLRTLLDEAQRSPVDHTSLRLLMSCGEPLRSIDASRARTVLGCEVVNQYGPSECTMVSTFHRVGSDDDALTIAPIGRPIGNAVLHILDEAERPVAPGEIGELYISGRGVSRGYRGRADLTRERFVETAAAPGTISYRTGDLVRQLPNGALAFEGRRDHQVKIRGFRIELGEVAATLLLHPALREAVVVARRTPRGDDELVAYVALADEPAQPLHAELRGFIGKRLPDYMVPASYVVLPSLPLTPNGKVDRARLPTDVTTPERSVPFVAPRTELERAIAAIWAEVLELSAVGIDDNFVALGGHSLLAIQIISRVRTACRVELRITALFEAETVAAFAAVVERAQVREHVMTGLPSARLDRGAPLPASFGQKSLCFLDRLVAKHPFYNIPIGFVLHGALDRRALQRALDELVARHEALRTTLVVSGGEVAQIVGAPAPVALRGEDLSALPAGERTEAARRRAAELLAEPFDLARGPLLRALLLRLAHDEQVLAMSLHHVVGDGWSRGILTRELDELYRAFRAGQASPLPPLAVQYAEFAAWEQQHASSPAARASLDFWRAELAGAPTAFGLLADHPRPNLPTYRGATVSMRVPAEVVRELDRLGEASNATLFMTAFAAFQVLLFRYTGQSDFIVGCPSANRQIAELEHVVGFFANTVPLRADLGGEPTFAELLVRARDRVLKAFAHPVPFEQLVEHLAPERDLSRNALVQTLFQLVPARGPMAGSHLAAGAAPPARSALGLRGFEIPEASARFDLEALLVEEEDGALTVRLTYSTNLYDAETIEGLATHYRRLLGGIAADPSQRISDYALLDDDDRGRLLVDWNNTGVEFPHAMVLSLFDEWAAKTPDEIAVRCGDRELSYRELDHRTSQLAWELRDRGIGDTSRVAICVDRSVEMIVAVVGVLKAGAAYVPLDPAYPPDRLCFMVDDSATALLLVNTPVLAKHRFEAVRTLNLDDELAPRPHAGALPPPLPDSIGYVTYTSGSTGNPKGVVMTHRSLANVLQWQLLSTPVTPAKRVGQFASLSFDASFQEIFAALCAGGTLIVVPECVRRDPPAFVRMLRDERVELLFIPFVVLQQLAEVAEARQLLPHTLREIVTAGEQLHITPAIVRFFESLPQCKLFNEYGPTEAHCVTCWPLRGAPGSWPALPPIGTPIANQRVYILDQRLRLVPPRVAGELWVGGAGVAVGYHDRAELTADRFRLDPYAGVPGARMYRTGDLARHHANGVLEYLGRVDRQIKIRGYRIEPGEIEAAISTSAGVREAAVIAREDKPGDRRLVAYVVMDKPEDFSVVRLRGQLADKLPAYMIPASFVAMPALPMTVNGKLDRDRLPPPPGRSDARDDLVPPSTSSEVLLAKIWSEILGVDKIGIHDNFFALGGHSLQIMQILSRIRDATGLELEARALFDLPTVASLAQAIDSGERARAQRSAIAAVDRHGELPLSSGQRLLWLIELMRAGTTLNPACNLITPVRLRGAIDEAALERALGDVLDRHEALRTAIVGDQQPTQVVRPPTPLRIERANLEDVAPAERELAARRIASQAAGHRFDLLNGPFVHVLLARLAADDHVLVIVAHHTVSDGWSVEVLKHELGLAYAARQHGEPPALPPLPLQYADHAAWQEIAVGDESLAEHRAYWKRKLDGVRATPFPIDRTAPAKFTGSGAMLTFRIPEQTVEPLRSLARELDATVFIATLAAFQIAFRQCTGDDDVCLASLDAARYTTESEPLIGFFLNMLLLRTSLAGDPSYRQLLHRTRETVLDAFAHGELPLANLMEDSPQVVDMLTDPRQLWIVFQVLPRRREGLRLPGIEVKPFDFPAVGDVPVGYTVQFDLNFTLFERDDGLEGQVLYSTEIFDRATVARIIEIYCAVLETVCSSPDLGLSDFKLSPLRTDHPEPTRG